MKTHFWRWRFARHKFWLGFSYAHKDKGEWVEQWTLFAGLLSLTVWKYRRPDVVV